MKKRLTYEAPEVELILVRFEENFLDSLNGGESDLKFGSNPGSAANPTYNDISKQYGDF